MITDTIVVAVLSLIGTLAGSYISNRKSQVLIAYRLEQLEDKVNKHNNLIERMYKVEEITALHEERLTNINHKLDEMERGA